MEYKLTDEMKNFIINNKELLQTDHLVRFYQRVTEEFPSEQKAEFTKFFISHNVDVLKYFNESSQSIPSYLYCDVNAKLPDILKLSDNIRFIGVKAFKGNPYIRKIILPNSLFSISKMAFNNCKSLEEVQFNSLPTIANDIFSQCPNLKKIYARKKDKFNSNKTFIENFERKILESSNIEIEWV